MTSVLYGVLMENMKFDIVNLATDYEKLPRYIICSLLLLIIINECSAEVTNSPISRTLL